MKKAKPTKRKRNELKKNVLKRANRYKCMEKRKYKDSEDAWDYAELFYIKHGTLSIPYRCCRSGGEGHYHLTSQTALGDLTHVPQHLRELFSTHTQEGKESTWHKIRRYLGVIK